MKEQIKSGFEFNVKTITDLNKGDKHIFNKNGIPYICEVLFRFRTTRVIINKKFVNRYFYRVKILF
jgi:hypothetical protein